MNDSTYLTLFDNSLELSMRFSLSIEYHLHMSIPPRDEVHLDVEDVLNLNEEIVLTISNSDSLVSEMKT